MADAAAIGATARDALDDELALQPKPGLVTPADRGSHADMDADTFQRAIMAIAPFLPAFAAAGAADATFGALQALGIEADGAMLGATGGVNTHRGAIFGLGLLAAAAGTGDGGPLGGVVARRWGAAIAGAAPGGRAAGARAEAIGGFRSVHAIGVPALRRARRRRNGGEDAARVEALLALIATVADTNLLRRGGPAGLARARAEAASLLRTGGTARPDWRERVDAMGRRFVARRWSPGGSADLLAMTLFVDRIEGGGA